MREAEFVGLMASLMALQALAIDVMLPALGVIADDLGAGSPNRRQLVIGLFLLASGVASILPGLISDRYGRRSVTLFCLVGFTACAAASAFVTTFNQLIALRIVCGLFSAGMMTMPITIIRDRFSGDRMARTQSLVAMTFMAVPMLAPLLGQGILLIASWRWIFGAMALLAAMVTCWAWQRLPETLHEEYRQPSSLRVIAGNMGEALRHRGAMGYFLGFALIQGALFGYINSAQQLVAEALGAGALFPAIFGAMALLMAGTNFVNSRIVEIFGARRISHTALLIYVAAALVHVWIALTERETLASFVVLLSVIFCCMSFLGANFQSIAMEPFARIAGSAASILSFVRVVIGTLLGIAIGQAFDGTSGPLALAILFAGVGTLLLVAWSEHGQLFKRRTVPA